MLRRAAVRGFGSGKFGQGQPGLNQLEAKRLSCFRKAASIVR
jgi:hypothetical protein